MCLERVFLTVQSGEKGIRTPEAGFARLAHFECAAIDHSAISPGANVVNIF